MNGRRVTGPLELTAALETVRHRPLSRGVILNPIIWPTFALLFFVHNNRTDDYSGFITFPRSAAKKKNSTPIIIINTYYTILYNIYTIYNIIILASPQPMCSECLDVRKILWLPSRGVDGFSGRMSLARLCRWSVAAPRRRISRVVVTVTTNS